MNAKRLVLPLLTGLLTLAIQFPAFAQATSGLRGQVLDKDGSPLPGVTITVANSSLGVSQGAVTDGKGEFRIVPLPPGGGYALTVQFPEMAKVVVPDIELSAGRIAFQPVTLRPSSEMIDTIKVVGAREVVNTEKTETSTKYSSEFIDSLPILGRNYQDVLTLAPGVSDTDGDGNPNIHGARDTEVVTLVDGVSTVDPLTGQVGQQLNIDSIQEIEVKTSGASAEFSRGQGGFVTIVTKSGGNDFEGSFKMFWQSNVFDGDGAGIDDPKQHGGLGEIGLRDLDFNTFKPFLSLSGPIKRDKAWYFFTAEYIQEEEPVNALTQSFVRTEKQSRGFGKLSWDISSNHKLVFTATIDPQEFSNQGVTSFIALESGFTEKRGGTSLVLKETAIFSPNAFLETTVQRFVSSPEVIPTLNADTNGNGVLFDDRNGPFGVFDAAERDPGEDFDGDSKFDVFEEDIIEDQNLVGTGVGDQDGKVTAARPRPAQVVCVREADGDCLRENPQDPFSPIIPLLDPLGRPILRVPCEGLLREDYDCDGHLTLFSEDVNGNGRLDAGEDTDSDSYLDLAEDRNLNNVLDDRPGHIICVLPDGSPCDFSELENPNDRRFLVLPGIDPRDVGAGQVAVGEFHPYGTSLPLPRDRDYRFDNRTVRTTGPRQFDFTGDRGRITLKQDLTLFVADWRGQHDLKMGAVLEREHYDQTTNLRPFVFDNVAPLNFSGFDPSVAVVLPAENQVSNEATSTTFGMYVEDTYKPLPNLTLKLGLRFDREATDSFGWTPFDPAEERALFDKIGALRGFERGIGDDGGNGDGISSSGYCTDPLFADLNANVCNAPSNNEYVDGLDRLRFVASSRLTQHHTQTDIVARNLATLFPDAINPDTGAIDRDVLRQKGGATFQEKESFRLTNNNLAPRVSVSWDPWGDSKTRLFANWSRLYDKLFLNAVVREEGPDTITRYYSKDPDGVTDSGIPNAGIGTTKSKSPPSFSQVDRGLQTPFADELSLGFEREIAPEVSLKLTYITKKFRLGLQDRDINHHVRFDENGQMRDDIGRLLSGGGSAGGAAGTRVEDNKPDLYINNFFFNQILRLGNFNESRFKAIEAQITKRLSRKWQLEGSYTYSRALGDAEDFTSQLGDDPASVAQEFGPLNFDQRHVVRMNAVTFLPGDWQLGSTLSWQSGLPFTTLTTFVATDNYDFIQNRRLFGTEFQGDKGGFFVPERRNSQRNASVYNIDLQASKAFVLGRFNSKLFMTVKDLLNSDDLTIATFEPNQSNRNGNLQLDSERQFGRRFEVGIQLEF